MSSAAAPQVPPQQKQNKAVCRRGETFGQVGGNLEVSQSALDEEEDSL